MKKLRLVLWAGAIACFAVPSAQACRVVRSPQQRVDAAYEKYPDLQVAIVKIESARRISNQMLRGGKKKLPAFELPWRAIASVVRVVRGGDSPELVLFDRGYSNCDPETPLPATGDIWVIYYVVASELTPANVLERYPLDTARQVDERIKGELRISRSGTHSSP